MVLSISNILIDTSTLVLPLPVVVPLQMARRQKASLLLLFATGGFVCGVAIRRTVIMPPLLASADYTYDAIEQFHWCFAEVNAGIVCASVPALKPFFVRYMPRLLGSALGSSANKGSSSPSSHHNNRSRGRHGGFSSGAIDTVVERNKERRNMQGQGYELRSRDDSDSADGDYRSGTVAPEEDEGKLWKGPAPVVTSVGAGHSGPRSPAEAAGAGITVWSETRVDVESIKEV